MQSCNHLDNKVNFILPLALPLASGKKVSNLEWRMTHHEKASYSPRIYSIRQLF